MANISFGNNVPLRTPHRRNVEAFTNALNKIDEKAKESLQTQNQIQMALANLDINGAEDSWRAAYARNIQNQLDDAALYGDYSRSLNTARMLAGQVASDPAVLGRVKAQAAYKQFNDNLDKRQDITQDVKDWAKDLNPYHYEDKTDKEGHIVGGTTWEPNKTPVSTVDLSNLMTKAKQWTAVHKGAGVSDIKFVDADGNLTSDPSQNVYGMAYKKSGSWEYLSEKDLNEALKSAIDTTPGARASLQQDYDVALWKYNKMTDAEKKKNIDSDITENGLLLSPEEYLAKRVKPGIHAMAYHNSSSDIEVGNGQVQYRQDVAARQAAAQNAAALNGLNLDATNEGAAIDAEIPDVIGSTKAGLDNTLNTLRTLFPKLSKSNAFNRGVTQGKYDELANLCRHSITTKDPVKLHQARQAITALRNFGNQYNTYMSGVKDEDDKAAVAFDAARRSGSPLPTRNKYSAAYNQQVSKLFGVNPNGEMGYKCKDVEAYNEISQQLGCRTKADWAAKGFTIKDIDGDKVICFRKNNTWLSKLSDAAQSTRTVFGHTFGDIALSWGSGSGLIWTNTGEPVNKGRTNAWTTFENLGSNDVAGWDYLSEKIYNTPALSAKVRARKIYDTKGFGKVPVNSKMYSSTLDRNALYDKLASGQIDDKTYNIALEKIKHDEDNLTNPSFLMNAALYVNGERIPEDEKSKYIDDIAQAKQENALNITSGRNHWLAQTVTEYNIGKGKNSTPQTITMIGANGSSVLQSYDRNTSILARDEATRLNVTGTSKVLGNGGTISHVSNDGAVYTNHGRSQRISKQETEMLLRREINRQQIADGIATGEPNEVIQNAIIKSLEESGQPVNNVTLNQEYKFIKDNY